jgi:hypothetical protein
VFGNLTEKNSLGCIDTRSQPDKYCGAICFMRFEPEVDFLIIDHRVLEFTEIVHLFKIGL